MLQGRKVSDFHRVSSARAKGEQSNYTRWNRLSSRAAYDSFLQISVEQAALVCVPCVRNRSFLTYRGPAFFSWHSIFRCTSEKRWPPINLKLPISMYFSMLVTNIITKIPGNVIWTMKIEKKNFTILHALNCGTQSYLWLRGLHRRLRGRRAKRAAPTTETLGALDLHARSTTLEIKICSCTCGQKGRTVALRPVHCTCTHGQNFPFGFLGLGNLDPRLHTGSRFSFRATTVVRPSQHLTVPSGVPFVFDEDENRENKKV